MTLPGLPPPKPIPLKERAALVFVERAQIDVVDGAFVAIDADGVRVHIPIGGIACLMLEPGGADQPRSCRASCTDGDLVTWVGEAGVRFYSAGQPGGARSDRLCGRHNWHSIRAARLRVVRKMYAIRFGETAPLKRSIDQLRGIEGQRVRNTYRLLAQQHGVAWNRRNYDPSSWNSADVPNRCLSAGTACLHGLSEAAVLAAGYAPAIGFLHTGKPRSFVYDIADLWKLESSCPEAFRIAALAQKGKLDMSLERAVRLACRDSFRKTGLLQRIIPTLTRCCLPGICPNPIHQSKQ